MGVQTKGQEGEPYVHRNQLFYKCKPDANKRKPPLTSPAPKANGGYSKRCYEHTSIDMTLGIVGISEMQKCGLKYEMHTLLYRKGVFNQ